MTTSPAPSPAASTDDPRGEGNRRILALALPALGALVAEPLFVLVDSAVVGHLGTAQLAGLTLASTLLTTVVMLCVFLAYATTAAVARQVGAGDRAGALASGVDGAWLAAGLGVAISIVLWLAAPWASAALGGSGDVVLHAVSYLRWSTPGVPGMLVVLATMGALRGVEDLRTPLVVAVAGAVVNAALNVALVYGAGMGIAGSGLGTAISQTAMGTALALVLARAARAQRVRLRPNGTGILRGLRSGAPLLVRTLSLRLAILLTAGVAAALGEVSLAGHQVVIAVWGLAALVLDSLAIAAQVIVGQAVGTGSLGTARAVVARTTRWGVAVGGGLGVLVAASGWWLALAFTHEPSVRVAIATGLAVAGLLLPLGGYVFVLDGVLIGAGDGRYLAGAGMLTLAVYVPVALAVGRLAPDGAAGLAWLWLAFAGVFMAARALTTGLRARGESWFPLRRP